MTSPLQVIFHGMDRSEAVDERIVTEMQKLGKIHPRITSARVTIEAPPHHKHKGNIFAVGIVLDIPGSDLAINTGRSNNPAHQDIYIAIRDAFAILTRNVKEHTRRHNAH